MNCVSKTSINFIANDFFILHIAAYSSGTFIFKEVKPWNGVSKLLKLILTKEHFINITIIKEVKEYEMG